MWLHSTVWLHHCIAEKCTAITDTHVISWWRNVETSVANIFRWFCPLFGRVSLFFWAPQDNLVYRYYQQLCEKLLIFVCITAVCKQSVYFNFPLYEFYTSDLRIFSMKLSIQTFLWCLLRSKCNAPTATFSASVLTNGEKTRINAVHSSKTLRSHIKSGSAHFSLRKPSWGISIIC